MVTVYRNMTAEQLLATPGLGRCELVRGELVMMTPAGFEHGCIAADLCTRLCMFVRQKKLGHVTGAETGFQIAHDPDTVRAPDVGFVRAERVPATRMRGFFQGPPDLAVEVLSPDDRASQVLAKVNDWLGAGCLAVWGVDPAKQTVSGYHQEGQTVTWGTSDELSGGDLLPGFRLPVAEIFAE